MTCMHDPIGHCFHHPAPPHPDQGIMLEDVRLMVNTRKQSLQAEQVEMKKHIGQCQKHQPPGHHPLQLLSEGVVAFT